MKGLLNRLVVTQTEKETQETGSSKTPAASTDSQPVEWADISAADEAGIGGGAKTESESEADTAGTTEPDSNLSAPATSMSDDVETMDTERLLETVLDGVGEPTMVVDSAGEITHINQHACDRFETAEPAAVGSTPAAVHGGETLVGDVLETGTAVTEKTETVVLEDTEHTLCRTITPFRDESGTVVGAMETTKQISDTAREKHKTEQLEAYQEHVLDDLQDKLRRLAEGDLTLDSSVPEPPADFEEIQTVHDEFMLLNDHLTTAVENYQSVLSRLTLLADDLDDTSQELSANSEEVTASIEEISQSTEEMADGSEELAEQTDEADMAIANLTATIEEITASVQEIDAETSEASTLALEGVEDGTEAVKQIRSATDATSEITAEVRTLESKMEQVDEVLEVISDIADQTNILALNASIEAARAGEAGDGFAVVADEVKSLAEESKESAAAIETIILEAQDQTAAVAKQISHTNEEVADGADAVETVVDEIEAIEAAVEGVSAATAEVSDAVENQAENMDSFGATIDSAASMSEELSASVQQISAGLEQQSTATDQVADRATTLSATSDELYERIDQFRLQKDESADVDDIDQA